MPYQERTKHKFEIPLKREVVIDYLLILFLDLLAELLETQKPTMAIQ